MSATPSYATGAEAIAAFRSGGRRWVYIAGHLCDVLTLIEPERVEVRREGAKEPPARWEPPPPWWHEHSAEFRDEWNRQVEQFTASALKRAAVDDGEVLPELAAPSVECCRACGRPLIGAVP